MTRLIRFVSHLVLALAAGKALAISGAYDAGGGASIPLLPGEWVLHSDKSAADYGRSGQVVVSSRPSDAIAIAVRSGCTIYCQGEVLDIAGKLVAQGDEFDGEGLDEADDLEDSLKDDLATDDLVDEFRDFIDSINPEDFQP